MGWLRANQGDYSIEFLRQTGKLFGIKKTTKHVEWVIDQKDSANHIDYSFDFSSLNRRATVGGKPQTGVKNPVAAGSGETYTLRIEIGRERIIVRDAQGKELDRYERPSPGEPLGRFGFKGDVALVVKEGK